MKRRFLLSLGFAIVLIPACADAGGSAIGVDVKAEDCRGDLVSHEARKINATFFIVGDEKEISFDRIGDPIVEGRQFCVLPKLSAFTGKGMIKSEMTCRRNSDSPERSVPISVESADSYSTKMVWVEAGRLEKLELQLRKQPASTSETLEVHYELTEPGHGSPELFLGELSCGY